MSSEVMVPITVPDTSDKEKEAWRVINDNFLLFSRRLNDMRAWITSAQYYEIRNTYVFSDQDSLDATYPFEMDFEIVSEMTSIDSVKLSFRIREFRAYSTTVPSGGGHTTASGGGHTTPSGGGHTTPSGGGKTSGSGGGQTSSSGGTHYHELGGEQRGTTSAHDHEHYYIYRNDYTSLTDDHTHTVSNHTHSCPSHTHTVSDHTHTVSNHQHAVANHTHTLTFGIYEDSQSPAINVFIDNGAEYGNNILTNTTVDADSNLGQTILNVTSTTGYTVGDTVRIGRGTDRDEKKIIDTIQAGISLTMTASLTYTHTGVQADTVEETYTADKLDEDITSSISGTGFKRVKFDSDVRCRISAWVMCKVDLTA